MSADNKRKNIIEANLNGHPAAKTDQVQISGIPFIHMPLHAMCQMFNYTAACNSKIKWGEKKHVFSAKTLSTSFSHVSFTSCFLTLIKPKEPHAHTNVSTYTLHNTQCCFNVCFIFISTDFTTVFRLLMHHLSCNWCP